MEINSICISFIVAIFGIAYPILFQVVSRLDEKYRSILILELFNKEKERLFFIIFLITSLTAILLYILKLPRIIDLNRINSIIDNSAVYLLLFSTVSLIISFFFFVRKILIYYTPSVFLKYLINKQNKLVDDNHKIFKAISDILYYSIREQNETIAKTVSDYMYLAFENERSKNKNKETVYPISYYELIYKSSEELANLRSKKLAFLEYRILA